MTALLDYALTTVDDVKESMGIASSDSSKDNLIRRKINMATEMIEKATGRRFKKATYTEYLDGTGTDQLLLSQRPITSITSINVRRDVDNTDDFDTIDSSDYFFTAGSADANAGIIDAVYGFSGGYDRYKIVYEAGYDTIPSDLQEACVALASFLVENGNSGTNVKSKQEGQRKVEYFDANLGVGGSASTLFQQLNIDEIIQSYANAPTIGSK